MESATLVPTIVVFHLEQTSSNRVFHFSRLYCTQPRLLWRILCWPQVSVSTKLNWEPPHAQVNVESKTAEYWQIIVPLALRILHIASTSLEPMAREGAKLVSFLAKIYDNRHLIGTIQGVQLLNCLIEDGGSFLSYLLTYSKLNTDKSLSSLDTRDVTISRDWWAHPSDSGVLNLLAQRLWLHLVPTP